MLLLKGSNRKVISVLCALVLMVSVAGASTKRATKSASASSKAQKSAKSKSSSTKSKAKSTARNKRSKKGRQVAARKRGQQAIGSDRTREIQEALIRARYLDGEPTGTWDQETKNALIKYQGDNGWQTKIVPDSRALIKLGLGPSHEGLLNPDSAALGSLRELGTEREIPGGAMPQR